MKIIRSTTVVLFFLLPFSLTAQAENPSTTETAQPSMDMSKGMGMQHGTGMKGEMTEEQKTQHLRKMQEHILQMHDLSNRILAEKDPAKKEQLKNEQLQLMKAHQEQKMQHRMERMQKRQQMHNMESTPVPESKK